jgi:hypothetical protein
MSNSPQTATVDDTGESLKSQILLQVQTAYAEYQAKPKIEAAGPENWWDLYLIGPYQPGAMAVPPAPIGVGPQLPHRIIRTGETFWFITVLFLNPSYPAGISACNLLSSMACPYQINYYSGSLQNWAPAPYNTVVNGTFSPTAGCFYVDWVGFQAQRPDLIEMNVTAKIMNCNNVPLPDFGGFATAVYQFSSGIFGPGEGFSFNVGSRFLITD